MKKSISNEIIADKNLIGYCGLYCAACRTFLAGKCPGCQKKTNATWCKVRECCISNGFLSCADCNLVGLNECKKYNSFIAKAFGLIFNSDRAACIERIKKTGYDDFAVEMALNKRQTFKRR